jgi:hypothetical protein
MIRWWRRLWVALVVLLASAVMSCGNSPVAEERIDDSSSELVVIPGTSCVSLLAGQTSVAGSVCAVIDGDDLVLTYSTSGDWRLYEAQLWAGLSILSMPQTNSGNPKVGLFPFKSGALGGVSTFSFRVRLSTFGLSSSMEVCAPVTGYVVAHAVVKRPLAGEGEQSETAYGEGTRLVQKGNWATWFSVLISCEDPPPDLGTCEAAFAFGNGAATCFIGSGLVETNRWGWTNGPLSPGSYSFPLYAGAGKCDLTKGTQVGSLFVAFDGAVATVSYSLFAGFKLDDTALYVGNEPLAKNNGEYTVAPASTEMSTSSREHRLTASACRACLAVCTSWLTPPCARRPGRTKHACFFT